MITMRTQLAPALLLLLVLLAAAAPLVPALTPQEIRDRKINGANKLYIMSADPAAYAGEKTSAPESKEAAPKDAVQKTSYVMGAGVEPKPESKSDEKVLEAKINAEVKQMRKEAAHDDAVAEKVLEAKINAEVKQMRKEAAHDDAVAEKKAKEFKSKPKNTTDDAEDHAKEKKSESKLDYSVDADGEKKEKKSKNKDDDSEEKKSKSKSEDDDDDEKKEKKSKSKSDDYADDTEKKVKDKDKDEDDDEKKEKKSKSKEDDSEEKKYPGAEKKSKEKSESSEDAGEKKKSKSKNKDEDFDAVPIETKADESMPAADTPDGYVAPAKKTPPRLPAAANGYQAPTTTMSVADTPDGFLPPTTMSAADTPDGYVTPSKAKPAMSAADTPDGYVTPSKAKPAMSATDSPDGYVPATDSPDGNVPASDSPDGYTVPFKKPKLNVQSFEEMVPRPVLDMLSPVVKSLCAKTRFPYTCETSIAKLPETTVVPARQKDGLGVLNLAIDAVRAKIMEATKAAKDLTADPRMDQITKSAIKDCITLYDDVKTSYDTGLAALKRGDKSTATTAFDSARTYVDTCDNGFLDRPALKPVIAGQEKILAELSSNVLAINKYM